jgi:chorismate--pyruvate lyase
MFNPDKFQWRPFSVNENIPEYVIAWLLDNQSLTAKLRNKYDDFCVNVYRSRKIIHINVS